MRPHWNAAGPLGSLTNSRAVEEAIGSRAPASMLLDLAPKGPAGKPTDRPPQAIASLPSPPQLLKELPGDRKSVV